VRHNEGGIRGEEDEGSKREGRENERTGGKRKTRIYGLLCEKNQVLRAYAFSEGGSPVARRGPRALRQKERSKEGR